MQVIIYFGLNLDKSKIMAVCVPYLQWAGHSREDLHEVHETETAGQHIEDICQEA